MRKKISVIILTALVFFAGAVLGVSSVYRVDEVTVEAKVVSVEAEAEAEELKLRLYKAYRKDSTLFADKKEAEKLVEEFPYFYMTKFEKSYPNRLVIEITEDAEVYAAPCNDGTENYYILSRDGEILGVRESSANRFDGSPNVLMEGLTVTTQDGRTLTGDDLFPALLDFCGNIDRELGGIRSNVLSAAVQVRNPETVVCFSMREGVKIYVRNPSVLTSEKAEKAVAMYLALQDAQRLNGCIVLSDKDGELLSSYQAVDPFQA